MATPNQKPATAFRSGNVNVAVWENTGETGPFFSITFSRPYKDAQGAWTFTAIALNRKFLALIAGGFFSLKELLR